MRWGAAGRRLDRSALSANDPRPNGTEGAGRTVVDQAPRLRLGRLQAIALAVAAAVVAAGIASVALRAWRLDLDVPISYSGDALLHLGYVQNMIDSGWHLEGPRLGAPFGQQHHDYPLGPDNLHLLILRLLTMASGEAVASVNLFYLLTFPLAAISCFWALRQLRVPGLVSMVGAIIFAVLPYHFVRTTGHLFLAAYYTVPLSGYLIVATLEGRVLFPARFALRRGSRSRNLLALAGPVALTLLIASGGAYYAAFTLVLLAAATMIGWLHTRSRRVLLSGALLITFITAFLGLNSTPTLMYWVDHGRSVDVPVRDELETERHALRPLKLIMPVVGHRLEPLDHLARRYDAFPTTGEHGDSLGLVASTGLVGLGVVAVTGLAANVGFGGRRWLRHRRLAALTLIALLVGTTGGASTLVALLVSPQIRAWSRISIFIAFLSLLAVCLVMGSVWSRLRHSAWAPVLALSMAGVVGVAALDQTADRFIPAYGALREQWAADRTFVQRVEAALPPGAAVYQLPYRPYLEGGARGASVDYDPMRGYLHSERLRWSYGGMKGREAGWQLYVHGRPISGALPIIALAGFSAVWVDRLAYEDEPAALERSLRLFTASEPLVSADQRFAVFDIRAYAGVLRQEAGEDRWSELQQMLTSPIRPSWREGAQRGFVDDQGRISRGATGRVELALLSRMEASRRVVVSFTLATAHGPPSRVDVRWPDGASETLVTSNAGLLVVRTLAIAPGENVIELTTDGPQLAFFGGDVLRMRITDLWVMDSGLLDIAESRPPST
jgi:hypothetical protein